MRDIYSKRCAYYPCLSTDRYFTDFKNKAKYTGYVDDAIRYIEDFQLLRKDLWKCFVDRFRERDADDFDCGWRGEYWGKMMRGACFIYAYTENPQLYRVLEETVSDILSTQEKNGRISTYSPENEFIGWDIWARKYVLLGMQYFLEICKDDELAERIVASMCKQLDYIIAEIGDENDGKKSITAATNHWRGLNSSSILEPVVRLYTVTGDQKYFAFAEYIVNCGGTDVENIFDLAYENKLFPYQYPYQGV